MKIRADKILVCPPKGQSASCSCTNALFDTTGGCHSHGNVKIRMVEEEVEGELRKIAFYYVPPKQWKRYMQAHIRLSSKIIICNKELQNKASECVIDGMLNVILEYVRKKPGISPDPVVYFCNADSVREIARKDHKLHYKLSSLKCESAPANWHDGGPFLHNNLEFRGTERHPVLSPVFLTVPLSA